MGRVDDRGDGVQHPGTLQRYRELVDFFSRVGSLSSRHSNDMAGKDKQLINRTFTIIIVLICFVLFLISAITYSFVEQKDMRNKYQTLIGSAL